MPNPTPRRVPSSPVMQKQSQSNQYDGQFLRPSRENTPKSRNQTLRPKTPLPLKSFVIESSTPEESDECASSKRPRSPENQNEVSRFLKFEFSLFYLKFLFSPKRPNLQVSESSDEYSSNRTNESTDSTTCETIPNR